ncbi:hypothetical protein J2D69_14790 [Lysinibacillus sphaericus]|uniref:Uncharacterized protein n=2 Tax=Lysinibacillus TaxID=400634 RepID=W7RSG6_LYSSH|nr:MULTISPECIES: hypothetical protein [Lysinibacillus]MBE5084190.1 hypothetical protein [Bacillus thuringiensis]AMO33049.1 hypothetical protein AR327_11660 [Lysinibacillus sphaericus]AMR91846.1 hypothetical protein A1T07_17550 [Lysinibacillus sphaericus]ANA45894.1 hypothetical protein A2J09_10215 [Lysinibacillus sphaericus]EWH33474.1 hypothetical protein P799_12880 [Lysinibacillus sphaericus CBAM5]
MSIKLGTLDISYNEAEEILLELSRENMDELSSEVEGNIFELIMLVKEQGNILNKEKSQHRELSIAGRY